MHILDYIKLAKKHEDGARPAGATAVRIAIATNFTDDLLKKALAGMCVSEDIDPDIYQVGYKQYLFELKAPDSGLAKHEAAITFVFFDANPYSISEFAADAGHASSVAADIAAYCARTKGTVVVQSLASPSSLQHGRILKGGALSAAVVDFNQALAKLALEHKNLKVIDTDHIVRMIGEAHARDMRGQFAFSQPFSHDFLYAVAREWMSYVRILSGKARKCIVVDLDNTLWGGILGETGPLGIALGTEYPGNAFVEFQRSLLGFYEQGIILAINSRNNMADVDEVFEKNPHMVLQKKHFGSIVANWNDKATNLRAIAEDLNIGLDSLVFIDDDPMNRDLVRTELPEVLVPDWTMPPEEYVKSLLAIDAFQTLAVTDEDKERGKMYAAERERKAVQSSTQDMSEYLKTLDIAMIVSLNDLAQVPRVAQLTQKTNQFNLSTRRSTEQEIQAWIQEGALVYAGDVKDKFGPYGLTILAIVKPNGKNAAELVTFLMSCRVMGRQIEQTFMRAVATELGKRGIQKLSADFIPTKKNAPSSGFLSELGAREKGKDADGTVHYELDVPSFLAQEAKSSSITVSFAP